MNNDNKIKHSSHPITKIQANCQLNTRSHVCNCVIGLAISARLIVDCILLLSNNSSRPIIYPPHIKIGAHHIHVIEWINILKVVIG